MTNDPADKFSICFAFTLGVEGGYTHDRDWTGGLIGVGELRGTKFGISAAAYPGVDIANLTAADAEVIYRRDYWAKIQGYALPWPVAMVVFDAAVNAGVAREALAWRLDYYSRLPTWDTFGPGRTRRIIDSAGRLGA